jgi:hypothetical protein
MCSQRIEITAQSRGLLAARPGAALQRKIKHFQWLPSTVGGCMQHARDMTMVGFPSR